MAKPDASSYLLAALVEGLFKMTDENYAVSHYNQGEHSAIVRDSDGRFFTLTVAPVDPALMKE